MFHKLYKKNPNPGQTISAARVKASIREDYLTWIHGIPDGHIERFLEEGFQPFLKRNGYRTCYVPKDLTRACKEWAFAHVRIQQKGPDLYDRFFMKYAHNGGEDEFDWFIHSIPFDSWEALCNKWSTSEFFDDSDAGYAQIIDIAHFAWQVVHLDSSPNHHRWKETIEPSEHDDDYIVASHAQPTEDTGAYGGDRRTL
jgi:hypothetical protein